MKFQKGKITIKQKLNLLTHQLYLLTTKPNHSYIINPNQILLNKLPYYCPWKPINIRYPNINTKVVVGVYKKNLVVSNKANLYCSFSNQTSLKIKGHLVRIWPNLNLLLNTIQFLTKTSIFYINFQLVSILNWFGRKILLSKNNYTIFTKKYKKSILFNIKLL